MDKTFSRIESLDEIAKKRIDFLLQKAIEVVKEREADSKNYVLLAQKIAKRHRIPLGRKRKMMFCKKCASPWIAGFNLTVRMQRGKRIEYKCKCGQKRYFLYGANPKS